VRHRIQYKLSQGDVLTYEKELTQLVQRPDGSRLEGAALEELVQEVVSQQDGVSTVLLTARTLTSRGPLAADNPADSTTRKRLIKIDSQGSLLDRGAGMALPQIPAFPQDELSVGQAWHAVAPAPDTGVMLQVQSGLEAFEQRGDEVLAQVVTVGETSNEDQGYEVETQAAVSFSVTHGHQVSSTTVIRQNWQDGRVGHTVFELRLKSRRNPMINGVSP